MHTIDINCDLGEGFPTDAQIMPFISSANIACGYHAGNESSMQQTVALALASHVAIGAHPGFADKDNFGRREVQLSSNELFDLVTEQIYGLSKIAASNQTKIHHVKPHGALYTMSARDPVIAATVAKAIYAIDPGLLLVGLSGSNSISAAKKLGLQTVSEVFADRTYEADGSLTSRTLANAFIDSTEQCIKQVRQMILEKTVTTKNEQLIPITAQTICIHGDGTRAVDFAFAIFQTLQQHQIQIQSIHS